MLSNCVFYLTDKTYEWKFCCFFLYSNKISCFIDHGVFNSVKCVYNSTLCTYMFDRHFLLFHSGQRRKKNMYNGKKSEQENYHCHYYDETEECNAHAMWTFYGIVIKVHSGMTLGHRWKQRQRWRECTKYTTKKNYTQTSWNQSDLFSWTDFDLPTEMPNKVFCFNSKREMSNQKWFLNWHR